ncbi:MAG: S24 family peptidase [Desulfobacteraceae bacterium]|nr:S24 family peptidase [Desulfobacteraceae bacterium]
METEFHQGDIIVINPYLKPEHNDYVVVSNEEGEATFKQLKKYGRTRVLHPLNPKYDDIELRKDTEYRVVGVALGEGVHRNHMVKLRARTVDLSLVYLIFIDLIGEDQCMVIPGNLGDPPDRWPVKERAGGIARGVNDDDLDAWVHGPFNGLQVWLKPPVCIHGRPYHMGPGNMRCGFIAHPRRIQEHHPVSLFEDRLKCEKNGELPARGYHMVDLNSS